MTIDDFKITNIDSFIDTVKYKVQNYQPKTIKRVMIPKKSGGERPLGIPTLWDRLIQQMFKQVLDPIVEAKFHKHSYGFRSNRSTQHALARCHSLINLSRLHFVIDLDIKGFFDNVNHHKLIQQLYTIGIKDKRVLTIINKMLKAPIKGIGIPTIGTPQGGILSPLLANVVLNELDWWISSQWETHPTHHTYCNQSRKYELIRNKNLKEMFIVRYADDVKIFTRDAKQAQKIFIAVKEFLHERLGLELSNEKSKITNLRRHSSIFLGFEIKAVKKKKKYVAISHISKNNYIDISKSLREQIKLINKHSTGAQVQKYNVVVLGIQNYFQYATKVSVDLSRLEHFLLPRLHHQIGNNALYEYPKRPRKLYRMRYRLTHKAFSIQGMHLFPIGDIRMKKVMCFSQVICNYTIEGREKQQHKDINSLIQYEIQKMYISESHEYQNNIEYLDNRISKYSMQRGKCNITNIYLKAYQVHCHHVKPKHLGGTDMFSNLVIVSNEVHKLIHATTKETIDKYMKILNLKEEQLKKLNKLREKCNLDYIK